jgi:hypothetical protein
VRKRTKRAQRSCVTLRNGRENPQKNLIYQIQRRNKSTSKSNKPETHSPPASCLRKTLFPQIIPA